MVSVRKTCEKIGISSVTQSSKKRAVLLLFPALGPGERRLGQHSPSPRGLPRAGDSHVDVTTGSMSLRGHCQVSWGQGSRAGYPGWLQIGREVFPRADQVLRGQRRTKNQPGEGRPERAGRWARLGSVCLGRDSWVCSQKASVIPGGGGGGPASPWLCWGPDPSRRHKGLLEPRPRGCGTQQGAAGGSEWGPAPEGPRGQRSEDGSQTAGEPSPQQDTTWGSGTVLLLSRETTCWFYSRFVVSTSRSSRPTELTRGKGTPEIS